MAKYIYGQRKNYKQVKDGRKDDAVEKIDLFAKFLANCPNSCQLECFQTYKEPVCVDGQGKWLHFSKKVWMSHKDLKYLDIIFVKNLANYKCISI